MNADWLKALSERIVGCAFTVANTLGAGFLEKVYENALAHELRKNGLAVAQQRAHHSIRHEQLMLTFGAATFIYHEGCGGWLHPRASDLLKASRISGGTRKGLVTR